MIGKGKVCLSHCYAYTAIFRITKHAKLIVRESFWVKKKYHKLLINAVLLPKLIFFVFFFLLKKITNIFVRCRLFNFPVLFAYMYVTNDFEKKISLQ